MKKMMLTRTDIISRGLESSKQIEDIFMVELTEFDLNESGQVERGQVSFPGFFS